MTKITKLNKTQVQMLRSKIQKKLDEVGNAYGMTISLGNISYNDTSLGSKVEATVNKTSSGVSFEKENFISQCWGYGLKADDYLKEVKLSRGQVAKIFGFNHRAKKFSVLLRTALGQQIKSSTSILSQLKK